MKRYLITKENRYLNLNEVLEINSLFKSTSIEILFKCISKDKLYGEIPTQSMERYEAIKRILTTLEFKVYTTSKTDYQLYMQNRQQTIVNEVREWKVKNIAQ